MPRTHPELEEFMRAQWSLTVAVVTRTTGDRELAEDAVQEALTRYLRGAAGDVDNLAAWTTVVARNIARDRLRSLASERRALARWAETREIGMSDDPAAAMLDVRAALALLPSRQREVCALRFLAGCTVEQVALELGVTTGTVKTQLHRARRRLGVALAA